MTGRPSILTDDQWAEIARRQLAGESVRSLSREFKIAEAAIRNYLKRRAHPAHVREVAHMLNDAHDATKAAQTALHALPLPEQAAAMNLAHKLRSISEAAASMAETSARSSIRLAHLANTEVQKIDDADPMAEGSAAHLRAHVVLQEAANRAITPAMNLLAANRDMVKQLNEEPPPAESDEALTPERLQDGARRIAFVLQQAAKTTPETH